MNNSDFDTGSESIVELNSVAQFSGNGADDGTDGGVTISPQTARAPTLRDCVAQALSNYFKHLDGQAVTDVYEMVLAEVEAPLLEEVLRYTRNNQTKASTMLGLNRGTLRKKLKQYDLL